MIVGVVGEMASGKTTVSEILSNNGFTVIHVDQVGHKVISKGNPAYYEIINEFGRHILNEDGSINRRILGKIVFGDYEKMKKLNSITHKYIFDEVFRMVEDYLDAGINNIAIDAALLFEIGLDKLADKIWYVDDTEKDMVERLMKRNNLDRQEATERLAFQHEYERIFEHKDKADKVIVNDGDMQELEAIVKGIIECR